MPNTLLSIDEYAVVNWEKYMVVTFFSHLEDHHIALLEECFKKKEFQALPTVLDCVRISEVGGKEIEFFRALKSVLPKFSVLSNPALNESLKAEMIFDQLPIQMDFKAALSGLGVEYNPKLDAAFVNSFVQSTAKVFSSQTGETVSAQKPFAQKTASLSDYSGIIPANSTHFSGLFMLSFPTQSLKTVFQTIFKHPAEDVHCELEGFLSEIVELIHESARMELKEKGYVFYPASATVVRKGNVTKQFSEKQVFLYVPMSFKSGTFQIGVGVEGI